MIQTHDDHPMLFTNFIDFRIDITVSRCHCTTDVMTMMNVTIVYIGNVKILAVVMNVTDETEETAEMTVTYVTTEMAVAIVMGVRCDS